LNTIDAGGCAATPGFIDQPLHTTGRAGPPPRPRKRRARPAGNISERRGGMAESTTKKNSAPDSSREESYRMAKLLRAGNRELARQLNLKKARR